MSQPPKPWLPARRRRAALCAIAGPGLITLLAIPKDHPPTAAVAVLYVLAVVISARIGGSTAGVAASLTSFVALNFFFTQPLHTFEVGAPEDLVALFAFLAASLVVGLLLSSALDAKTRAERREWETRLMNRMEARLLSGEETSNVLADLASGIAHAFDLSAVEISTPMGVGTTGTNGSRAAPPNDVLSLRTASHDLGAIRYWTLGTLLAEDRNTLTRITSQLTIALESMRLSGEVRRVEMEAQASHMKAALFSGVTHDVKTPLAAITASVTSLLEGRDFDSATRREHLETIRQEADRLHRVVNNLLDIARLRAGALVATKTPSAIDELMESVLNRMRPMLKGRLVEIRVADDIPEIEMDVVQLDQVLTNLIENAVKFTADGTPITLSAVGADRNVRVTVSDHGKGIPREDRERIFEPFERGNSGAGTGLGLAICRAIIIAHGGRIWMSETPQGGASFTFELPATVGSEEEVIHLGSSSGR